MRYRHLGFLLALAGCAGAGAGGGPEPESAQLGAVWLVYVEPVQSPLESEYATVELRRLLQESGRFQVVDAPDEAHAIVRTELTLPLNAVADRANAEGATRNRDGNVGTTPFTPPNGRISLALAGEPETTVWTRSYALRRWRPSPMQAAGQFDQQTVGFLAMALSGRLVRAAGPGNPELRTP